MRRKIYPKEWLGLHPYKQTNDVDRYYVDIANRIYDLFRFPREEELFYTDEKVRRTCLCLAAWFEDVISQTGIWRTFTAECKRRYGAYLPFYPIKEDAYFPDEINVEDIRFLLWHHLQVANRRGSIINPENPGIKVLAEAIYGLLDEEYETAPENERMRDFLFTRISGRGKEDFFRCRELLDWFHYHCYFNIENIGQYVDHADELMGSEDLSLEFREDNLYGLYISLMFGGRQDPLSLTSPEWLALICGDDLRQPWSGMRARENCCCLLEGEDDRYLYVRDLCREEEGEIRIAKESMDLPVLRRKVGESVYICELIYFGDAWWQCGMFIENKYGPNIDKLAEDLRRDMSDKRAVFQDFLEASGGKRFVFCRSRDEAIGFLRDKMGYTIRDGLLIHNLETKKGVLLMCEPHTGLHIQNRLCECVKSPDNPYYDKAEAERNGILFIVDPSVIPYQLSCILQDEGMLPDACLNSLLGKDRGREIVRANGHFLTDYFFHQCREKDFIY